MSSYVAPIHKARMKKKRSDTAAAAYRALPLTERRRRNKSAKLRRFYGISLEEFDVMLKQQGFRCPGCGTDTPGGRGWNVHHSHKTNKILAILCHLCNRGSGLLADDPVRLRRLAEINEE